jgi:hypothetical protein
MRKEYDFSKGTRGATIPPDPRKTRITIRIDTKILNWFRQRVHEAGGGSYQTMINDALKNHIESYKCRNQEFFSCVIDSTTVSFSKDNWVLFHEIRTEKQNYPVKFSDNYGLLKEEDERNRALAA